MRSLRYYILVIAAILTMGCETEDTTNDSQSSTIVSYLEGSHSPKLIAESEVAAQSQIETNPAFYTRYGNYAYRYIETYYEDGRDTWAEVKSGSTIEITYSLYPFSSSFNSSELPTYSNNPDYEQDFIDAGLNTEYWDFSPLTIKVGSSDLFPALHDAFTGCREGDIVEIYTTYLMGYDNIAVGTIDKEDSMVMFLYIESVK